MLEEKKKNALILLETELIRLDVTHKSAFFILFFITGKYKKRVLLGTLPLMYDPTEKKNKKLNEAVKKKTNISSRKIKFSFF